MKKNITKEEEKSEETAESKAGFCNLSYELFDEYRAGYPRDRRSLKREIKHQNTLIFRGAYTIIM